MQNKFSDEGRTSSFASVVLALKPELFTLRSTSRHSRRPTCDTSIEKEREREGKTKKGRERGRVIAREVPGTWTGIRDVVPGGPRTQDLFATPCVRPNVVFCNAVGPEMGVENERRRIRVRRHRRVVRRKLSDRELILTSTRDEFSRRIFAMRTHVCNRLMIFYFLVFVHKIPGKG